MWSDLHLERSLTPIRQLRIKPPLAKRRRPKGPRIIRVLLDRQKRDALPHADAAKPFQIVEVARSYDRAFLCLVQILQDKALASRIAAGVRITMKRTGKKNTIIGTVNLAGSDAAFFSAAIIRNCRFSFAIVRRESPSGVP